MLINFIIAKWNIISLVLIIDSFTPVHYRNSLKAVTNRRQIFRIYLPFEPLSQTTAIWTFFLYLNRNLSLVDRKSLNTCVKNHFLGFTKFQSYPDETIITYLNYFFVIFEQLWHLEYIVRQSVCTNCTFKLNYKS